MHKVWLAIIDLASALLCIASKASFSYMCFILCLKGAKNRRGPAKKKAQMDKNNES
jgi:hypothetical protein